MIRTFEQSPQTRETKSPLGEKLARVQKWLGRAASVNKKPHLLDTMSDDEIRDSSSATATIEEAHIRVGMGEGGSSSTWSRREERTQRRAEFEDKKADVSSLQGALEEMSRAESPDQQRAANLSLAAALEAKAAKDEEKHAVELAPNTEKFDPEEPQGPELN